MPSILFEYKSTPSYGYKGMQGGSAITVYNNGVVVLQRFTVGCPELTEKITLLKSSDLASAIGAVLSKHQDVLSEVPSKLNNGSLDGSHDCFRFGAKHISSWSIARIAPQEILSDGTEYCKQLRKNAEYENLVLDVYSDIEKLLIAYGLGNHLPTFAAGN